MIIIFRQNNGYVNRLLSAAASLLALFSFNIRADTIVQDDVHNWLKENTPQTTKPDDGIYYSTGEFATHFISPSYALAKPNVTINEHGFKRSNKKIAKANERKLLRRISDKLKINLFKADSKYSNHRLYINTLKRELVGKSRIGRAKYEIRVSEKQAEAHFRYTF